MRLVEGLHRVGNDLVACYLVADDDGVTLIDAGLSGQWPLLVAELTAMGRTVSEIRGVVLTHGDSDHIGFAERLRAEYGIPVWVHEADAGRARGEGKPSTGWGALRPGPLLRFLWYAARRGGLRTTYGHSPGSVAVHVPAVDALFVGDALTTRHVLTGREGPGPAPFTDQPEVAASSVASLDGVEARWVLPGHGAPWNQGVSAALRQYRSQSSA